VVSGWIKVHGFQYGGDDVTQVLFFPFAPGYVAVIAILCRVQNYAELYRKSINLAD
jgi:hypothetical protein